MKKSLLAGASISAIVLATGAAQAADLPTRPIYKAPAMAPAAWSWTGFYLGGNVGFVSGHSSINDDPATSFDWLGAENQNNNTGVIGGVQVGYNYQISSLVLGIEGDFSGSSLNHTVDITGFSGDSYSTKLSWLATVRGRVGFAFDRFMVYGTGGVAFADLKDELNDTIFPFTASPSSNVTGWTAGGGVEYALTDHWTVKGEYLHVDFGDRSAPDNVGNGYSFAFKDTLDIGRIGVNYKF